MPGEWGGEPFRQCCALPAVLELDPRSSARELFERVRPVGLSARFRTDVLLDDLGQRLGRHSPASGRLERWITTEADC